MEKFLVKFLLELDSDEKISLAFLLRAVSEKEKSHHTYSKAYLNKKRLFFYLEQKLRGVLYDDLILDLLGGKSSLSIRNTKLPEDPPEPPTGSSML